MIKKLEQLKKDLKWVEIEQGIFKYNKNNQDRFTIEPLEFILTLGITYFNNIERARQEIKREQGFIRDSLKDIKEVKR